MRRTCLLGGLAALLLTTSPLPAGEKIRCIANETCADGHYCACYRNRNAAVGDCDEMGGFCRELSKDPAISRQRLDVWRERKAHLKRRYQLRRTR